MVHIYSPPSPNYINNKTDHLTVTEMNLVNSATNPSTVHNSVDATTAVSSAVSASRSADEASIRSMCSNTSHGALFVDLVLFSRLGSPKMISVKPEIESA
ncbi:hypothetical protein B5X24_HaOG204165 [Helicoverpa armigera]|uniref:Uncharacterized protein n=1 Tax=Helicoverpa armigera TaxID=29058 RepID=A0A2W1BQW8_HELAM|nr:hypothetical protein B5X24_HaOG204165 [Helicoverpa armigera]